uniref:L-type lectin-domain containing receptor kinase IX.1-like n=1 Tax=Erigeron canadensis TaxID=72917 RepID=UPI001CB8B88E|nr:L-type lectin-domain containing receptor kinase IX.1-like [Erigeron canadensis]
MGILACFLLALFIPYATSITFNFSNITPKFKDMYTLSGAANISDGGIQVTSENKSIVHNSLAGRVTYIRPLHLWDHTYSGLASFSTSFTFVIASDPDDPYRYSDGLTFFLAENNSVISGQGAMGLPFNTKIYSNTNPFVAVEFDTFCNDVWDDQCQGSSQDDHVGINVNSLTSVKSEKWMTDIPNGKEYEAWIKYDSTSKNLSVSFTGYRNNTLVRQGRLDYTVDLRDVLPEWVIFGFSASTSLDFFEKHNVRSWMFNSSSLQVDKEKALPPTNSPKSFEPPPKEKNKTGRVLGLIAGPWVVVTFFTLLLFCLWRKNKKNLDEEEEFGFTAEMNNEFEMGVTGPRRFSYGELARSTAGFSDNMKLAEGGFGAVYKGFLRDTKTYVAVKRVSKTSKQGIKEYASEVKIISRLRHRNLVKLTGWCHEKRELLLVYEFMENGSLDLHLFKGKSLLSWGTRYKIAHGLAFALLYLHEEWEHCVLHRDIKSSNVMLDSNFNAKLGDFGLAKLVDHDKSPKATMLAGTLGYMAPECVATGMASKQSDVYSFGVVALEIACGRKPIDYMGKDNQTRLIEWVWELYGTGSLLKAADSRLGLAFHEEEIKCLLRVGLWCVHPDSELRPTMRQVIQVLKSETSMPILPSKMPVASYLTPAMSPILVVSNEDLSNQKALSLDSSYLYGR